MNIQYFSLHCCTLLRNKYRSEKKRNRILSFRQSLQQVSRQHHHPTLDLFCCCSFRNFKHLNYKPNELWVQKPHGIESRTGVSAGPPTVSKSPSTNDVPANDVPKELYLHHYEGGGLLFLYKRNRSVCILSSHAQTCPHLHSPDVTWLIFLEIWVQ